MENRVASRKKGLVNSCAIRLVNASREVKKFPLPKAEIVLLTGKTTEILLLQ